MSAKTHGTSRVYSRNLCGLPDETIRLEVRVEDETVWLSGAPFFMPLRLANKTVHSYLMDSDFRFQLEKREGGMMMTLMMI